MGRGLGEGSGALEGIGAGGWLGLYGWQGLDGGWGSMGGRGWRAGDGAVCALRGKGRILLWQNARPTVWWLWGGGCLSVKQKSATRSNSFFLFFIFPAGTQGI